MSLSGQTNLISLSTEQLLSHLARYTAAKQNAEERIAEIEMMLAQRANQAIPVSLAIQVVEAAGHKVIIDGATVDENGYYTCLSCHKAMRPRKTSKGDYPKTVTMQNKVTCRVCYEKTLRRKKRNEYV